jgi:hypothetical protein
MRTNIAVKLHQIMAFQAFFLYGFSAMWTISQIMDVPLGTVRTCEKLPAGAQEEVEDYDSQSRINVHCQSREDTSHSPDHRVMIPCASVAENPPSTNCSYDYSPDENRPIHSA